MFPYWFPVWSPTVPDNVPLIELLWLELPPGLSNIFVCLFVCLFFLWMKRREWKAVCWGCCVVWCGLCGRAGGRSPLTNINFHQTKYNWWSDLTTLTFHLWPSCSSSLLSRLCQLKSTRNPPCLSSPPLLVFISSLVFTRLFRSRPQRGSGALPLHPTGRGAGSKVDDRKSRLMISQDCVLLSRHRESTTSAEILCAEPDWNWSSDCVVLYYTRGTLINLILKTFLSQTNTAANRNKKAVRPRNNLVMFSNDGDGDNIELHCADLVIYA